MERVLREQQSAEHCPSLEHGKLKISAVLTAMKHFKYLPMHINNNCHITQIAF
jgi:hypothetical protein